VIAGQIALNRVSNDTSMSLCLGVRACIVFEPRGESAEVLREAGLHGGSCVGVIGPAQQHVRPHLLNSALYFGTVGIFWSVGFPNAIGDPGEHFAQARQIRIGIVLFDEP
jgi:hypothetical protein